MTPHVLYTNKREWAPVGCDLTWFKSIVGQKVSYALLFTQWINHFSDDDKRMWATSRDVDVFFWSDDSHLESLRLDLWQTADQDKMCQSKKE